MLSPEKCKDTHRCRKQPQCTRHRRLEGLGIDLVEVRGRFLDALLAQRRIVRVTRVDQYQIGKSIYSIVGKIDIV